MEIQRSSRSNSITNWGPGFDQIIDATYTEHPQVNTVINVASFHTPLGPMIALGDETVVYLLDFMDESKSQQKIEQLQRKMKAILRPGTTKPLASLEQELAAYFAGSLQQFTTPVCVSGTFFQKRVWTTSTHIPYGETRSYADQAAAVDQPTAYRAVANANSANSCLLIMPCHRVIRHNSDLGGYASGAHRKKWLIEHEKKYYQKIQKQSFVN